MIKLYENGVYLLNGTEIVEDTGNVQVPLTKEEAAQNTMAYGILKAHNTSENMERLQIRFDKLTSHDIHLLELSRQHVRQDLRSSRCRMYLQIVITVFVQLVEQSTKMIICLD